MKPATRPSSTPLKRGWTTGACAAAATHAAYTALLTGEFPDPVSIVLPKGQTPSFALALEETDGEFARAGIIKDAGDDPDVTHGALVIAKVAYSSPGTGVTFKAGEGVGTVTLPGLPIPPGEPAINPVPRRMIENEIAELSQAHNWPGDVIVEISIPGGEALAEKTWNPRLGIRGGLSILGTTGIVNPFSCSAWIHSIHRGIDVAIARSTPHVVGSTGSTSEAAAQQFYGLADEAMLDMGDFAGGMLKYLKKNPVPRVTIAGGFAKMVKLGQGFLDLHSGRSQVDFDWLSALISSQLGDLPLAEQAKSCNSALEVLTLSGERGDDLAMHVARRAAKTAEAALKGAPIVIDILVIDRQGNIIGRSAGGA